MSPGALRVLAAVAVALCLPLWPAPAEADAIRRDLRDLD